MIEHDPNLANKKFPENPTRSYRTKQPLRVVGEVFDWKGHSPEADYVGLKILNGRTSRQLTTDNVILD